MTCIKLLWLAAALGVASPAAADQFLGVETQGGDSASEAPAATKKAPKAKEKSSDDDNGGGGGAGVLDDLSLSAGFGVGPGYVDGDARLDFSVNKYAGIDTIYWYYRVDQGDTAGQQYGPEVDLVLRYPNKTILTPYAGAGPGYIKWQRTYQGKAYDESASPTASAFGGLYIRLTHHFGLDLERRQVTWLGYPPKRFDDRTAPEPRSAVTNTLGFRVVL